MVHERQIDRVTHKLMQLQNDYFRKKGRGKGNKKGSMIRIEGEANINCALHLGLGQYYTSETLQTFYT